MAKKATKHERETHPPCPKCGSDETRRLRNYGHPIGNIQWCTDCQHRFEPKATKLTKQQRRYEGSTLCQAHAESHGMPEGTYVQCEDTDYLGSDEPIKCEVCSTAAMRRLGVI